MAVQPIVDLRTGEVHAHEALARFGPGAAGSPLQWFSLADEFGERDALERACLRAALDLFAERPPGMRLSVNLSAPVLLDRRTLRMLDRPFDLSGLIIEVTEEALVQSDVQLRAAMAPLRERGALPGGRRRGCRLLGSASADHRPPQLPEAGSLAGERHRH